jgi:ribosomal protein S27AE
MEHFRHNLTPVEVKIFLKTAAELTDNLLIRYCIKLKSHCPKCGHQGLCESGAVSLFSSNFDKLTHEMRVCLKCGYKNISALLTCEKL